MTRMSIELPGMYPRRFLWWFECDRCKTPTDNPAWNQRDFDLQALADSGWRIGKSFDTCPDCLSKGVEPDEPLVGIKHGRVEPLRLVEAIA